VNSAVQDGYIAVLDLAANRVEDVPDLLLDGAQLWIVGFMPGTNMPLFLIFAVIVIVTSLGIFVVLRQKQVNRPGNMDNSAWFLTILLVVAILSIGSFIAFIFLRGFVG
jgi:hypothetical protein